MPNRLLRDGILNSKRINALSEGAELFYRRLMSVVDDYGRCEADLDMLLASCYPLRRERTTEDVAMFLEECSSGDHPLVLLYDSGRKTYLEILDFNQRLRSQESKFPGPSSPSIVLPAGVSGCPPSADNRQPMAARAHARAHSTTTTPTSATSSSKEESARGGGEPIPFPSGQTSELGIEGWTELIEAAASAGMSFDPEPSSDLCQKVWRKRDFENRKNCIQGILARVQCGQYSHEESQYVPTLANYVQKNLWRESLRPRIRGQPAVKSKRELQDEKAFQKILEEKGNGRREIHR